MRQFWIVVYEKKLRIYIDLEREDAFESWHHYNESLMHLGTIVAEQRDNPEDSTNVPKTDPTENTPDLAVSLGALLNVWRVEDYLIFQYEHMFALYLVEVNHSLEILSSNECGKLTLTFNFVNGIWIDEHCSFSHCAVDVTAANDVLLYALNVTENSSSQIHLFHLNHGVTLGHIPLDSIVPNSVEDTQILPEFSSIHTFSAFKDASRLLLSDSKGVTLILSVPHYFTPLPDHIIWKHQLRSIHTQDEEEDEDGESDANESELSSASADDEEEALEIEAIIHDSNDANDDLPKKYSLRGLFFLPELSDPLLADSMDDIFDAEFGGNSASSLDDTLASQLNRSGFASQAHFQIIHFFHQSRLSSFTLNVNTRNQLLCHTPHRISLFDVGLNELSHQDSDLPFSIIFETSNFKHTYVATDNAVFEFFPNTTREELLNDMIAFADPGISYKICKYNSWNDEKIILHTLRMGLKNRDLSVVQSSLRDMSDGQMVMAACLCMEFASTASFTESSDFKYQYSHMLLSFITDFIQSLFAANESITIGKLDEQKMRKFEYAALCRDIHDSESDMKLNECEKLHLLLQMIDDLRQMSLVDLPQEVDETSDDSPRNAHDAWHSKSTLSALFEAAVERSGSERLVRWREMDEDQIVLVGAHDDEISSALSFLNTEGNTDMNLSQFKERVVELAFQELRDTNIDYALVSLRNIGHNANECALQVMMEVTDRNLRRQLFEKLDVQFVTEEIQSLFALSQLLEQLYPIDEDLPFTLKGLSEWSPLTRDILLFEKGYNDVSEQAKFRVWCFRNDVDSLRIFLHSCAASDIDICVQREQVDSFLLSFLEEELGRASLFLSSDVAHIARSRAGSRQLWTDNDPSVLKSFGADHVSLEMIHDHIIRASIKNHLHIFLFIYVSSFKLWEQLEQVCMRGSEESTDVWPLIMIQAHKCAIDTSATIREFFQLCVITDGTPQELQDVLESKLPLKLLQICLYDTRIGSLNDLSQGGHIDLKDVKALRTALQSYPILQRVVFPHFTDGKSPDEPTARHLLRLHPEFDHALNECDNVAFLNESAHRNSDSILLKPYLKDELHFDLEYFLIRCRLGEATEFVRTNKKNSDAVYASVRQIAFHHLSDAPVVSTCLCLLRELESEASPTTLPLEIEVALRILKYCDTFRHREGDLAQLFSGNHFSSQSRRKRILHNLEDATNCLIEENGGWIEMLSHAPESFFTTPWHLVARYHDTFQISSESLYTAHLKKYASQGQWIPLLFELEGYEGSVCSAILQHIDSHSLRNHLMFVFSGSSTENKNAHLQKSILQHRRLRVLDELHDMLTSPGTRESEACSTCLERAVRDHESIYALCAFCLDSNQRDACLRAFILSTVDESLGFQPDTPLRILLRRLIPSHCKLMCEAFQIFSSNTFLHVMLQFIVAFTNRSYDQLPLLMNTLMKMGEPSPTEVSLGLTLVETLATFVQTAYERSKLLTVLFDCGFSGKYLPEYVKLYEVDQIIFKNDEWNFSEFSLLELDVFEENPRDIVDSLLAQDRFASARKLAQLFGLSTEDVTRSQAKSFVHSSRHSKLWQYTHEREIVWKKVNRLFLSHNFKQSQAGIFFLTQLSDLYVTLRVHEIIHILKISLSWFDGSILLLEGRRARACRDLKDLEFFSLIIRMLQSCPDDAGGKNAQNTLLYVQHLLESLFARFVPSAPKVLEIGLTDEVKLFLDSIIDSLLYSRDFEIATKLSEIFVYRPQALMIADLALGLVKRELKPMDLPQWILQKIEENAEEVQIKTQSAIINQLLFSCDKSTRARGIRRLCRTVSLDNDICNTLNMSYSQLQRRDKLKIVENLIVQGPECWKLATKFVDLHHVDTKDSAQICALILANVLRSHFDCDNAQSRRTKRKSSESLIKALTQCSIETYNEYSMICKDGIQLGHQLLDMIHEPDISEECVVEIIIRCYWSFEIGSSLGGITDIMVNFISDELFDQLVEKRKFNLLIHLMLNLRKHMDLRRLFDALISKDEFDLILQYRQDALVHEHLKIALVAYLREHHPDDEEKLMRVYLRFSLCKELGDILLKRAKQFLSQVSPSLESSQNVKGKKREQLCDHLVRVKEHFESAVDALERGQCYRSALECENIIRLIEYQKMLICSQQGRFPVILSLNREQALQFMVRSDDFIGAYTVACVHELNSHSYWVSTLWNKAIIQGKLEYFLLYAEHLPVDDKIFAELLKTFVRSKNTDTSVVTNLKILVQLPCCPQKFSQEAMSLLEARK